MKIQHYFRSDYANRIYQVDQPWDRVLFESDSFVVLPSLGSLVKGWLLVVPKFTALSVGALNERCVEELDQLLAAIVPIVQEKFGPISVFEHGPVMQSTQVGCGVDHAHLHLVPINFDLLESARDKAPSVVWRKVSGLNDTRRAFCSGHPYYFLQQPFNCGQAYLGTGTNLPSQLFRRIIADQIGHSERYDWKLFDGMENILLTVAALTNVAVPESLLTSP